MTPTAQGLDAPGALASSSARVTNQWGALVAVSVATLMMLIDFMAVGVALPAVRQSLNASFPELEWVLEAFVLTIAALVLTAGHITDFVGRRPVFLGGLVVFALGSAFAGLAQTPYYLIGARVVQGMGGALLLATGSVLLAETFRQERGRAALAVWGTVTGLAFACSPFVGGLITSSLGWRWLFFLEVPVSLLALGIGFVAIREPLPLPTDGRPARRPGPSSSEDGAEPEDKDDRVPVVDWRGFGFFTLAIAIFVIGLVRTTTSLGHFTQSGVLACFLITGLLLIAFIAVETDARAPMLDISLFRQRTFTGSSIAAFGLSMAVLGPVLYLVLYFSFDQGYPELTIGTHLLLLTAMTVPFLPLTGFLDKYLPLKLLICSGLALVAAGLWLMSRLSAGGSLADLVPGLIVAGVGLELVNPRLASTAAATVEPHLAAVASRASSTFRQVGTAAGVAVFGSIFATQLSDNISNRTARFSGLTNNNPTIASLVLDGHTAKAVSSAPVALRSQLLPIIQRSFAGAMHEVFVVAAVVALASAVLALSVRSSDVPRLLARPRRTRGAGQASPGPKATSPAQGAPATVAVAPATAAVRSPTLVGQAAPVDVPAPAATPSAAEPAPPQPVLLPLGNQEAEVAATDLLAVRGGTYEEPGTAEVPGLDALAETVGTGRANGTDKANGAVVIEAGPGTNKVGALIDLTLGRRWVRGQVTDAAGEPLAGALVTLVGADGDEAGHAIAGEDGSFALGDVWEGTYTLIAAAPHFRPAASMVALKAEEATATVSLLGVGSLVGKVTMAKDGLPLAVEVDLVSPGGGLAAQCRTGNDGCFFFPDLLEGSYDLLVRSTGYRTETVAVVVDRTHTETIEIALVGQGHLYGAVSGPGGDWLPGSQVTLTDGSGEVVATTWTDDAGSYHFSDVPEGPYTVRATASSTAFSEVDMRAGSTIAVDLSLTAL